MLIMDKDLQHSNQQRMDSTSQMEENKITKTDLKIKQQIAEITQQLKNLGYPEILYQTQLSSIYFENTPSRFKLIQWLVATSFPQYNTEPQWRSPYSQTLSLTKKLSSSVWKLGLMPFTKHTKTMDYQKYIQGMLGYENAVKLIYDLVNFANRYRKFKVRKITKKNLNDEQKKFGQFLNDLFVNYQNLVNQNYDPYGVTFPPAFEQIDQMSFQKKYEDLCQYIQQTITNLQHHQPDQDNYQTIFKQAAGKASEYEHKMNQLTNKFQELDHKIEENEYLKQQITSLKDKSKTQFSKNTSRQNGRLLDIPVQLCQKIRKCRQVCKLNSIRKTAQIAQLVESIQYLITQLNQNVII